MGPAAEARGVVLAEGGRGAMSTLAWLAVYLCCLAGLWRAVRWADRRLRARDLAAARRVDAGMARFVAAQRDAVAADVFAGRMSVDAAAALEILLNRLAEPTEAVVRRIYDGR